MHHLAAFIGMKSITNAATCLQCSPWVTGLSSTEFGKRMNPAGHLQADRVNLTQNSVEVIYSGFYQDYGFRDEKTRHDERLAAVEEWERVMGENVGRPWLRQ